MCAQCKLRKSVRVQNPVEPRVSQSPQGIVGRCENTVPQIPSGPPPTSEEPARFFRESPDLLCIVDYDVRIKILEQQVVETLDRERERMGRELHDGICQNLAGIAALSASLARRIAPLSASESAAASDITKLLGKTIRHLRDLARGHDPHRLHVVGLASALTDFCETTGAMFQVSCAFHGSVHLPGLDVHRQAHLYRIAQEAVQNAISHGHASSIEILLSHESGTGTLSILDNGHGMDAPPDAAHSGSGLHSMRYRATLLGGSLAIHPNLPAGTAVTCIFSLASPTQQP